METDVPLEQQADVAKGFLEGLVSRFGHDATVAVHPVDEDTVEVRVTGSDLGLLIGPKGQTLGAIQELARTVVQRQTGAHNGRLIVDVGGYRQARREALARFTREVAAQVVSSGQATALEPMTPADRKVVHDTATEIEGVSTTSEGEEPRRRVVIQPESAS
jgi:spoIIIJ-associated protein